MAKYKEIEEQEEKERKRKEQLFESYSKGKVATDNPLKGLDMIFKKQISSGELPTFSFLRQVSSILNSKDEEFRKSFYNLIKHLITEKAELLEYIDSTNNSVFLNLLSTVCQYEFFFIRDITTWKKKSRNVTRQFREILDHLFVKKVLPKFMYSAWNDSRTLKKTHVEWFIMMGAGESIKNEKTLPQNFTKKMLHNFLNAPDDFTIPEALMYGRVVTFGGDERLTNIINQSAIRDIKMNDFWDSVIKFFVENPMLDSEHITQIIDFLNYEKYQLHPYVDAEGKRLGPDRANQPNLTMKGRTVESLIRDSEEWHFYINLNQRRLEQERRIARNAGMRFSSSFDQDLSWNPIGTIKGFQKTEGSANKNNFVIYTIVELLTSKELREEGAAMSHCVGSYSNACVSGRSSIWSLRKKIHGFSERLVTIEINKTSLSIVQVRGPKNRNPDKKDELLINEWASKNNLKLSRWL